MSLGREFRDSADGGIGVADAGNGVAGGVGEQAQPPEEEMLRARFYALLARLLAKPLDTAMLARLRDMEGDDETDLGRALATISRLARGTSLETAEDEFTKLFYGQGQGGELLPYKSYYLTGFVYERPLAELRSDMERLGIARGGLPGEPEDHIAFICDIMHELIAGRAGVAASLAEQAAFFQAHLAPFAERFFTDMEGAEAAVLYMPVGTIGRLFMDIESHAFEMAA